jgi:tetratricopeptide (TPR) repeat protein
MPTARARRSRRRETRLARERTPESAAAARGRAQWERLFPLLVVATAVAAYHDSFAAPFVFDDVSIPESRELHELWSVRPLAGTTRPLVQLSLALNYALGGLNVAGYHAFNLTIHVLAALTFFAVVARTLRAPRLGARWNDAASRVALAVSVLWAVHPLQTESVTYVVQRSESLMALFYLLTLYCVIRGAASAHTSRWYAAAVVACALGMLSKPVMVTAPIAVLLYDRVFLAGSWRRAWHERHALYLGLAATWSLLVWLLAGNHESAASAGFAMRDLTIGEYARSQPGVILHYLRLAFWPRGLVLDYAWPVAKGAAAVALPALVLAALGAATFWIFRHDPALGFLPAAFFLTLAPSSSVIPIKDLAFEHRMYLPLAPLVALVVVGGRLLIERAPLGKNTKRRVASGLIVTVVLIATVLTIARNRDYARPVAMWSDVVTKRPENPRARNHLGVALFDDGRVDDAVVQLRTALRLDPTYADAHNNLGRALAAQGKYQDAEPQYREALRLNPNSAQAENNLGVALERQGRHGEAQAHYDEALRLKPDYAEARNNLGVVLAERGRYDDAIAQYGEALRLKPDYAEAYSNLGNALLRKGNPAEAERQYREALRMSPGYAEVHYNLALALGAEGKQDEATKHFAEALRLRPDLANAAAARPGSP